MQCAKRPTLVHSMLPRALSATVITFSFVVAVLLGGAGHAAAATNAPTWAPGNYWSYRSIEDANVTMTWTVDEAETVKVGSDTFDTWHLWQNTSSVSSGYSITFTVEAWMTRDGLRQVKSVSELPFVGKVTTTLSPPIPYAVFPLEPSASWSGTSTETTSSSFGTNSHPESWSGLVLGEASVTVPAGTFSVDKVRSPATGAPYTAYSYSDGVGWAVQIEEYDDNNVLTDSMQLTAYSYTPYFLGLPPVAWFSIVGVLVAVVAVAALVFRRRGPGGMPPQEPGQPPAGSP